MLGYEATRVRAAIDAMPSPMQMRFLYSPDHTAPNGVSLLAAESAADRIFYLQMVDHLFARPVLAQLASQPLTSLEAGRVLVDSSPSADIDLDDATRVTLSNDWVTAIGKGLASWDAIDAGCFVLTHAVFDALREVRPPEGVTVSSGMRRLVQQGRLGAVDIRGVSWVDVDTPIDRERAERILERRQPMPDFD